MLSNVVRVSREDEDESPSRFLSVLVFRSGMNGLFAVCLIPNTTGPTSSGEIVRQDQEGRVQLPRRVLGGGQPRGEGHDREDAHRGPQQALDSGSGLGAPVSQGEQP